VAQSAGTLGMANASPLVGPLVINEIMYRPPDSDGIKDNSDDEFIEVLNIAAYTVPLYDAVDSTSTWKLTGGVDFVFPTNQSLEAGEFLLLVNFNPANATKLAAFRAKYSVAPNVPIFGPYEGKLDNSGEDVELKKPAPPVGGEVPYVLVDKVSYSDSLPWPAGADGTGLSLQRRDGSAYGNDSANWTAAPPTVGASSFGGTAPVITAEPQNLSLVAYQSGAFNVLATGTPPLLYQWRFNGVAIAGATNSILQLSSAQPAQIGGYDVVVFNGAGSAVSTNATLSLTFPPAILTQPLSVQVRVPPDPQAAPTTNAIFNVTAFSLSPMSYQWRFEGTDIPGAISPTLTISNVQVADGGEYTVAVSDANGTLVSAPAALYPLVTPSIIQPPLSQSVVVGAPVTLSVAVSGSPLPITYEWRRFNSVVASNVVNSLVNFYSLTAPNIVTSLQYRVIVKNLAYTGIATNALITVSTLADSDGDGIPDVWESAYFGGATAASADGDSDGDGVNNWREYIAGTDPTNTLSYLKIDTLNADFGTQLSFMAVSNRTYTVQFTDALGDRPWQLLTEISARATNRIEFVSDRPLLPGAFTGWLRRDSRSAGRSRHPCHGLLPTSWAFPEMPVRKCQKDHPVLLRHGMFAGADVIAERAIDEFALLRHLPGVESASFEETIDRFRCLQYFKLAARVRPLILLRIRQQHRPRSHQRHETMLIKRQLLRLLVELLELRIEPVREARVDSFHGFTDFAAAGRGAAATGLVRNGQRDALIERRRQQRRFAIAGVSDGRNPPGIDVRVGHQIIDAPLKTPGPSGNTATVVRQRIGGGPAALLCEPRMDSVRNVGAIRIDVATAKRRERVATGNDLFERPVGCLPAARGLRGLVVRAALAGVVKPAARERDAWVGGDRMIPAKVLGEKSGCRLRGRVGRHQQQINLGASRPKSSQLQSRCRQKRFIHHSAVEFDFLGLRRNGAVNVMLKERPSQTPLVVPLLRLVTLAFIITSGSGGSGCRRLCHVGIRIVAA
jgi:hypothetical protein